MNHVDEKTLVQYVLMDEKIERDREAVRTHLDQCAGCKALHDEIREYYEEVSELQQGQSESGQALTLRRMLVRVPQFADVSPLSALPKTLPARFVLFVVRHPIISSFSFIGFLAGALFLLSSRLGVTDTNPAYARAKEEFLIAYNKNGEELWRKHVGIGFDLQKVEKIGKSGSIDNYLTVADVDKDGKNEVICVFGLVLEQMDTRSKAIVCYHSHGRERWKYEFHRRMTFGKEEFSDDYLLDKMMVGDFDRDGDIDIFGIALHATFYPTVIVRLDARDGTEQEEYWHSGISPATYRKDLDGDGVDELLFGGTNNGYNQASLLILDPRGIYGHAPAPPSYAPVGVPSGHEKYYILFPRSDLNEIGNQKRNGVRYMRTVSDGLLEVSTFETLGAEPEPGLVYYLDSEMRCTRVVGNDYFEKQHRGMEANGKLTKTLNPQYYEELRGGVRYWNGEKFFKQPTMNMRYFESMKSKNLP